MIPLLNRPLELSDQPGSYCAGHQTSEQPCLKTQSEKDLRLSSGLHPHMHRCAHAATSMLQPPSCTQTHVSSPHTTHIHRCVHAASIMLANTQVIALPLQLMFYQASRLREACKDSSDPAILFLNQTTFY